MLRVSLTKTSVQSAVRMQSPDMMRSEVVFDGICPLRGMIRLVMP
jgi:hypothetical protein